MAVDSDSIIKKIDELTGILRLILEDLEGIRDSLKELKPKPSEPSLLTVREVQESFPESLLSQVIFEQTDENIIVKPRGYLGPETFKEIAGIVDRLGGDYVSAGRESHFIIPRRRAQP